MPTPPPDVSTDCPQAPSFSASLTTLILHEACETAGGINPLANLLGVSSISLVRWLDGEEEPPAEIYRACIDIILLHDPAGVISAHRGGGSPR
jgi:hypothetical protein